MSDFKPLSEEAYRRLEEVRMALDDVVFYLEQVDRTEITRPEASLGESFIKLWRVRIYQAKILTEALIHAQRAYDSHNEKEQNV